MTEGRPAVGFIGAGIVGTALAVRLAGAGYSVVAVASRTKASAERLASLVAGCRAYDTAQDVADAAELVFLTTPDDAVAAVASSVQWRQGQSVVHCSGALSLDVLEPAARAGAAVGSFHPLQTFATWERAVELIPGSTFALEAQEPLLSELKALASALGGRAIELREDAKALYHAAAVLTSNYTVTLLHLATGLWREFGYERDAALPALLPLLRGTISNVESLGLAKALTGPISRGDRATVERHLEALAAFPLTSAAYRVLAEATIPLALEKGRLSPERAQELAALLASQWSSVH